MEDGYIGEIRMFGGNFAPRNWYFCNGSLISIADNQTLFAIIGTFYGGDGRTNMKLPDFRGVFPLGFGQSSRSGQNYQIGQAGGSESHALSQVNLPAHTHPFMATSEPGNLNDPAGALLGNTGNFDNEYVHTDSNLVEMSPSAIGPAGQSEPLYTMPPFQAINFIICHTGIFPSRS